MEVVVCCCRGAAGAAGGRRTSSSLNLLSIFVSNVFSRPVIFSMASSKLFSTSCTVQSSFAETYYEAPCSLTSPSQSRRLVILAWLAAIETDKNMILQTTNKWWWWVSQIRQAKLKFLPVLTQQQAVIGNRCSQNSQSLDYQGESNARCRCMWSWEGL